MGKTEGTYSAQVFRLVMELAEFVCGYLEFCKEQPESSKASLFKHLHLLMERAITYSWSSVL